MKKAITVIMALVLAATALCGCSDEDQSSSSVSDKSSDFSAAAATTPASAEDKDAAKSTNDTDNTENSVVPEDTKDTESNSTNSDIEFKEDAETVKQISLQLLTALKEQDVDKYLELCNAEFYKEWWIHTYSLNGRDDDAEAVSEMSTGEIKTYFLNFYSESIADYDWSAMDISDVEVTYYGEYESPVSDDDPYKECHSDISWDDGQYTLCLHICCKEENFFVSCDYPINE